MIKHIKNVDINFIQFGNKKGNNVVILHGWGQNIQMMKSLGEGVSENNFITILDLPGFGNSSTPVFAWTLDDYVEALREFLKELKINNPILIGHSFGGKISLMYASKYKVNKLVLLASPFKKEIKKVSLKTKVLKSLKKVPLLNKLEDVAKRHIGSTDYKKASPMMREVLVNHVNYDASGDASKIKCPTLIVWGTSDQAVNVNDAYELEKLISNSGTVIYENCTHYAYLERLDQTIRVLNNFFES